MSVLTFDSQDAEITAKTMEDGLGIRHATMHVNTYRNRMGKVILGQTCILGLFQRLKPLMTSIRKMKSGSNAPDSNWSKCRLKWAIQLLIMLGQYEILKNLEVDVDDTELQSTFRKRSCQKYIWTRSAGGTSITSNR